MKQFILNVSAPIRKHLYIYLAVFIIVSILGSTLIILWSESAHPDTQIRSIGDALWWSLVGISTIGLGNIEPVSDRGRFLTVYLMTAGVIVFSIVTAKIAAFFTEEKVKKDLDVEFRAIEGDIHKVEKNIEGEVRVDDKIVEDKLEKLEAKVEKLEKK